MSKFEKIVSIAVIAATIITPLATLAQSITNNNPVVNTAPITNLSQAGNSLGAIVNWVITIFWILTVFFLIWAAITYLTAGGDAEKTSKGKSMVIYAIIAAAIALLSTGLHAIVSGVLKTGTGQ